MFSPVKQVTLSATLCLTTTLFCSAQDPADHHNPFFISFAVHNSNGTFPTSINNQLTVTGYFALAEFGSAQGFVRDISGKIETFKVGSYLTQPVAINGRGEIVGIYQNVAGVSRAFIRSSRGEITTFNPGGDAGLTIVEGINDRGMVTGFYQTKRPVGTITNFLRYPDGHIVTFSVDVASVSYPSAINGAGEITGFYVSNATQSGGFLRSRDGHITTFEYAAGIQPLTINDSGTTAGDYDSPTGPQGFIRSADGKVTTFTVPGYLVPANVSINRWDEVAGTYAVQGPFGEGFVRLPDGKIEEFQAPGATATYSMGIDDFGVVTGYFTPASTVATGFLRIP